MPPLLSCAVDPLPQVPYLLGDQFPVDGVPVSQLVRRSDVSSDSLLPVGSVPWYWSAVRTSRTSATFRCGAKREPLSPALPGVFASSDLPFPLRVPRSLRSAYSGVPNGERSGVIVVPSGELRPGRVLPMLRWGCVPSSGCRFLIPTIHVPFWLEGFSLIALVLPDEAFVGNSLALTLLDFPLRMPGLRLRGRGACVTCIPPSSFRTTGVVGVSDPVTWGQRDGIR